MKTIELKVVIPAETAADAATQEALAQYAPSRIARDMRLLEDMVDRMLFRAGENDDLIRKQLADRHERMRQRTRDRNRIRKIKFEGIMEAEVVHTISAVMQDGKEVTLAGVPDARIDAIVLRAEMGMEVEGSSWRSGVRQCLKDWQNKQSSHGACSRRMHRGGSNGGWCLGESDQRRD